MAWRPEAPPCLDGVDEIELDCETDGLDRFKTRIAGLALGAKGRTWYLPITHRGGGNLDEAVVKRWALTELRGKRIRNLAVKQDAHWIESWDVPLREMGCTFHDPAHSEALLDDHETSFTLNHIAKKRLGRTKLDAGPAASIADQPAGSIAAYAMRDVELVRDLVDHYAPLLAADELTQVSRLEDDIIPVSMEMERNGMPLDVDLLNTWVDQSRTLFERLSWDLYRMVGFMVNPDSGEHMARLWKACGLTNDKRTATGKPSFTADVVQEAAAHHPAIDLLWKIGKLEDLRSKYLLKYQREHVNGVLYPTLHQLKVGDGGTVSGRFSCVRPNMQQVLAKNKHTRMYGWMKDYGFECFIKDLFVAPEGRQWVSSDLRQCEYRIFADYTRSNRLLDKYRQDPLTNFHAMVKQMLLPIRPDIDDTRVKVFNFLSIFGGGAGAASRNLGISMEDAYLLSDDYHKAFPEARALLNEVMQVCNARGYVKTRLGRRSRFRKSPGAHERERVHKSLNAIVQGTAADANKLSLVAVYQARQALGLTMRMTVHDSLEVDMGYDPATVQSYVDLLNTQRVPLQVPLLWDVKKGRSWGQCE